MQALSFTVHIPLVCFGIAFPVMVLLMEWWAQRTGDPLYRTIARRWSRVMIALFAIGAITGTVLSFEMGVLWPNFTATFGGVFGLGFAIEGFSFFLEAIFLGIYVYGWDRLSPRMHLLSGIPHRRDRIPGVMDGHLGQRMDEPPERLPAGCRPRRRRPPLEGALWQRLPVARAHPHVHRRVPGHRVRHGRRLRGRAAARALDPLRTYGDRAAADDRLARRADPDPHRRLGGAHDQQGRADQARRDRGPGQDDRGRPVACLRPVRARAGPVRRSHPEGALRARLPRPRRPGTGPERGRARRPAAGQRGARRLPDDGRHRHAAGDPRHPHRGRARAPTAVAQAASILRGGRSRGSAVRGR